jgi:hypothetical protein
MKVTATIREYIREEIIKILDSKVNPYAEQAEIDRKKMEDFGEELRNAQQKMIEQFVKDNEIVDCWRDRNSPFKTSVSSPSFHYARTPAMLKSEDWEKERKDYKTAKTREIIAKLELGANRSELEAMLAELASNP